MTADSQIDIAGQTVQMSERKVTLWRLLDQIQGYSVDVIPDQTGTSIYFRGHCVARCFRNNDFYGYLDENGVDWKAVISQRLLLDDTLIVIIDEKMFVIEIKNNHEPDEVEEALMLSDFKRKQYIKLVAPLGLMVEYVYVLNDWFKKPEYRDVLDYIRSVNCHYRFGEIPLAWLGLPVLNQA